MEYFNKYDSVYERALRSFNRHYKIKLELLTYGETVLDEIVKDISLTAMGQITKSSEQLNRTACNLTLINVDNKYSPMNDHTFWFNRKFKLWIGLVVGSDTYWWSQGVYYTTNATGDNHILSIQGVDKGGSLDGTLKTGMADYEMVVEVGSNLKDLINDILMFDTGISNHSILSTTGSSAAQPIDPILPLIDTKYNDITLQQEINLNSDTYIGEILKEIASQYNAEIFYNNEGRLVFQHLGNGDMLNVYSTMPSLWNFDFSESGFTAESIEYQYDSINAVTVYTNATDEDIENVSYTAYNNNPLSPMRIGAIGVRRMESQEISYIAGLTKEQMIQRCKEYANYLLFKNSLVKMSVPFTSYIIPHLQVNRPITITNKYQGIDSKTFLVDNYTIPLGSGSMSIQATNLQWLPTDTDIGG